MSTRTTRDKLHAAGPLVLRLGVAGILVQDGLLRLRDTLAGMAQTGNAADILTTTSEGVRFAADWPSLLGAGEMVFAGLFLVGWATRFFALVLGSLAGYSFFGGAAVSGLPEGGPAMALMAVACASLLVSGAGCVAIRRRKHMPTNDARPPTRQESPPCDAFVISRPPLLERIRAWFGGVKAPRPASTPPVKIPVQGARRRWPWQKSWT